MEMTSFVVATIATVIVILISIVICGYYGRRRIQAPGPQGYPFIGIIMDLFPMNSIHKALTAIGKRYGRSFQFKLLGKRMVVLRTASIMQRAFDDVTMDDRKEMFFQQYVLKGKGFAFANYRNSVPELRQLFHTVTYYDWQKRRDDRRTRELVSQLANLLIERQDEKGSINPDYTAKQFVTDIFIHEMIGETLPEDDPDRDALWGLIDNLYALLDPSMDTPLRFMPFIRFLPIKHGRVFKAAIQARDAISKRYFQTQKDTYQEGRIRGLVDVCIKTQREQACSDIDPWFSDDYIRGLMYDTIAAGMSELFKSIRMLILMMCHYPTVQSQVQAEIDRVIGLDDPSIANHRSSMPYTQAVLYEIMRYVSQTPLAIPHKCNKDVVLDGYLIEKDSGIFPNIWGIHHDEDIWGDPWIFRPERFLNPDGSLLEHDHPYMKSLIPFSVGKRRCPGEDFAMSRLFLVLTTLLQKVRLTPPVDEPLPSADPRLYTNQYPLTLPVYSCRAVRRTDKHGHTILT